jgi:hypothetical protein
MPRASTGSFTIRVENLRAVQKALLDAGGPEARVALRQANIAAANVVIQAAIPKVPVRSGALLASMKPISDLYKAVVQVGSSSVVYAGPIHWGWPKWDIKPQPFLQEAVKEVWMDVVALYEEKLRDTLRVLDQNA